MNKKIIISLVAIGVCASLGANDYVVSSDLRVGYVDYDFNNPVSNVGKNDSHGVYFAPKFSITTPVKNNFSAKVTVAGVTDFGLNSSNEDRNLVFDGGENRSFAMLQELYASYKDKENKLKIGRQELVTPLVESDDYYFLANSFDAITYTTTLLANHTFHLGYISSMSGVWDSGANGTEFHSVLDASFIDARDKATVDNSGIFYAAAEYKYLNHSFKIWEYYLNNMYNMALAEYNFSSASEKFSYDFGIQAVNFKEVGQLANNGFTNIDYSIYSVKFDGKFDNGISFATGGTKYSSGKGQGATLGAFGGFPTYTYGFAHSYFDVASLENAKIYKLQLSYNLSNIGIDDAKISYRYTQYDLDETLSAGEEYMKLNGVKFSYATKDGLSFNATYEHRNLDKSKKASAIRIIGGYKF